MQKKLSILQTETLKGWGGQQNKVIQESKALRSLGHEVFLICNPNAQIIMKARKAGFLVYELEMNKRNFYKTIPFFMNIFITHKINLIITHGSTDSWIGGLAARLSKIKPYCLRERHNLFPIRSKPSRWLHHTLFNGVLSVSGAVTDYLKSIQVNNNRIHYLPDSVDIKIFKPYSSTFRNEFNIPENAKVIGTLTALRKEKGIWDCFEVAKTVLKQPDVYFVFGGKSYPDIQKKITMELLKQGFSTKKIIWTGFRNDAYDVLNAFDIFLYPSHSEGLGTILLEAMACALPCVVYDIRPMSDLIIKNKNGLTAPFLDTKKLTEATEALLNNRSLANKFGREGRRLVCEIFSYDALKSRLDVLTKLITLT